MLILSITFFRRPVIILGELALHERISQTSGTKIYLNIYLYKVGFQDEKKRLTAPALFFDS